MRNEDDVGGRAARDEERVLRGDKQLETAASNIIPTNRVRAVHGAIIRLETA